MQHKVATCCYCGTRAALVLRGQTRHELSCAACGAPLHDLKALRTDRPKQARPARPARAAAPYPAQATPPPRRKPKRKKRKTLGRKLMKEAFDLIEDIFD